MSEHVSPEAAERFVQQVTLWYSEQIMKEQRAAGGADPERLKTLKDGLAACAADLETLENAGPEEVDGIAARYAALAQELEGQ
ncbi:hypothetical protein [Streptomyces vinaceus]|uniref:hypothetical protein n=1 Tax=Streptomyces vinaceus TaxID=1960 RepID=UPI0036849442